MRYKYAKDKWTLSDYLGILLFTFFVGVMATSPFWASTVDLVGFECDATQECEE